MSTNAASVSPVIPSLFAAHALHWRGAGIGERYSSFSSYSCSLSSNSLRNSIQASCEIRWASPSTPASLRMMSWMDLTVPEIDMQRRVEGAQTSPALSALRAL